MSDQTDPSLPFKISDNERQTVSSQFRGLRPVVLSETGAGLYTSNDTVGKTAWNRLEKWGLGPRARDTLLNRFPLKNTWDFLSLMQLTARKDLTWSQKKKCFQFYFSGMGPNNLMASLTRSGHLWLELTFAVALALKEGRDADYGFDGDVWLPSGGPVYCKLDWRTAVQPESRSSIYSTNGKIHYHTHHPYYRLRYSNLNGMKTVVLVRSILESLESSFSKMANSPRYPEVSLENDSSFFWDRFIEDAIEFYNSWGDIEKRNPNCKVFRYDLVKGDPLGAVMDMCDLWDLNMPEDCVREALAQTNKKAMKARMSDATQKENMRVSYRKKRKMLSDERVDWILQRLKHDLRYDFGYDYSENHEWGKEYE